MKSKFDAAATIWLWFAEILVWAFELDILTTLEKDGFIQMAWWIQIWYDFVSKIWKRNWI